MELSFSILILSILSVKTLASGKLKSMSLTRKAQDMALKKRARKSIVRTVSTIVRSAKNVYVRMITTSNVVVGT